MPNIPGLEHQGFPDRAHPVLHHRPTFTAHDRQRHVALIVLSRDHIVERVISEEFRPALELLCVEHVRVLRIEVFDFKAQVWIDRRFYQSPMTSRYTL